MSIPTDRQINALQHFGIDPPPTKDACSNFLGFILRVNDVAERQKRAAACRTLQLLWNGHRVRSRRVSGCFGTVQYISPKKGGKMIAEQAAADLLGMEGVRLPIFEARVKWDDEAISIMQITRRFVATNLTTLKLVG